MNIHRSTSLLYICFILAQLIIRRNALWTTMVAVSWAYSYW